MSYGFMLMDEATQASQAEALVPIMQQVDHICFVGDGQQLGPVVKDREVDNAGLGVSMFSRLQAAGVPKQMLKI